jgi:hypothetical protein
MLLFFPMGGRQSTMDMRQSPPPPRSIYKLRTEGRLLMSKRRDQDFFQALPMMLKQSLAMASELV